MRRSVWLAWLSTMRTRGFFCACAGGAAATFAPAGIAPNAVLASSTARSSSIAPENASTLDAAV